MHLKGELGLLYFIKFSTEYIQPDATVATKSTKFSDLTEKLLSWLESRYLSSRGPLCYDNPLEHERLFGNVYQKKHS